jgi:hypothetical protein
MKSILIDIDSVHILDLLKSFIEPIPLLLNIKANTIKAGCVLVIPDEMYNNLVKLEQGVNGRMKLLNSDTFLKSVINKSYISYCRKKNVCEFVNWYGHLEHAVISTNGSIKTDTILWANCPINDVNLDKYIDEMIEMGFESPYICNSNPNSSDTQQQQNNFTLCMFKRADDVPKVIDKKHVYYIINEFRKYKTFCGLKLKFDKKTIKFLRKLPLGGRTKNKNGSITQKEIAGALYINQVKNKISIHDKSVTIGKEEGVDVTNASFNFHSHPKEAYINHNTDIGYPSSQDYLGYLESYLNSGTIFHAVSTLEGLYIMSIHVNYVNNKKLLKSVKSEIIKKYKIPFNTTSTPYPFVSSKICFT